MTKMLDLTNTMDEPFAAALKPWINVLASVASRLWLGVVMIAGLAVLPHTRRYKSLCHRRHSSKQED